MLAERQGPGAELGEEACAYQGGLAAARWPEHGQEAGPPQRLDQMLRHRLASEEQRRVRLIEHFQTPIGTVNGHRAGRRDAATATRCHAADTGHEPVESLGIVQPAWRENPPTSAA